MTEQEYEAALVRINDLMDAEFGTPDGEELLALSIAVEAYEEAHFPMTSSDPCHSPEDTTCPCCGLGTPRVSSEDRAGG